MNFKTANEAYAWCIQALMHGGNMFTNTNRKGEKIYSMSNVMFTIEDMTQCVPYIRPNYSWDYLCEEHDFYMGGSQELRDAVKMSKFWNKCSDDGETVRSNYGRILFYDVNEHGNSQFEHAMQCLLNNLDSKKAVAVIYAPDDGVISNDNPCTMYLHFRVRQGHLHLTTHMRSQDVWFGLPYDVPFFCLLLVSAVKYLNDKGNLSLNIGTYTHFVNDLHLYDRNTASFVSRGNRPFPDYTNREQDRINAINFYCRYTEMSKELQEIAYDRKILTKARNYAKNGTCLKKTTAATLIVETEGQIPVRRFHGKGGPHVVTQCEKCLRDDPDTNFYGDSCYSVHGEMRVIIQALKAGVDFEKSKATLYLTHGPCDACLKLIHYVGIKRVVYDVPYKADLSRYKDIRFIRRPFTPVSVERGKYPD